MDLSAVLKQKLQAEYLEVIDESHLHAGHGNFKGQSGSHYRVLVVSPLFENKSLIQRHRMVNDAVFPEFQGLIHALAIKAKTPGERALDSV